MSTQALTPPINHHHHLSVIDGAPACEPVLSADDRAEIGTALLELLVDLHRVGALRSRSLETITGQVLEITLFVPGSGDVRARISRTAGAYQLSISGALWEDLVVLREADGHLGALYREYFSSQADQEKVAKERLVQGFTQLRVVKDWGLSHYQPY